MIPRRSSGSCGWSWNWISQRWNRISQRKGGGLEIPRRMESCLHPPGAIHNSRSCHEPHAHLQLRFPYAEWCHALVAVFSQCSSLPPVPGLRAPRPSSPEGSRARHEELLGDLKVESRRSRPWTSSWIGRPSSYRPSGPSPCQIGYQLMNAKPCILLVHGAFHGGWCWEPIATALRTRGYDALAPTLSGLNPLDGIDPSRVTLSTHIEELAATIDSIGTELPLVVGASYGGVPLSAALTHTKRRPGSLVLLDTPLLERGRSLARVFPVEQESRLMADHERLGRLLTVPPPPPTSFGIFDPDLIARVRPLLAPQPLQTFTERLEVDMNDTAAPTHYIACTRPPYSPLAPRRTKVLKRAGWTWSELSVGHDAMITHPSVLCDVLVGLARR